MGRTGVFGVINAWALSPDQAPKYYPLGQAPVGDTMERVAMDILEPGVIAEAGNREYPMPVRYILVLGDYYIKWTKAYATPNHTACIQ